MPSIQQYLVLISLCKYRTRTIGKLLHFAPSLQKMLFLPLEILRSIAQPASVQLLLRFGRRFPVKLLSKIDYWPGYRSRYQLLDIGIFLANAHTYYVSFFSTDFRFLVCERALLQRIIKPLTIMRSISQIIQQIVFKIGRAHV